jgi:hypothetical protein
MGALALTVTSVNLHKRQRLSLIIAEIIFRLCTTCLIRLVAVEH